MIKWLIDLFKKKYEEKYEISDYIRVIVDDIECDESSFEFNINPEDILNGGHVIRPFRINCSQWSIFKILDINSALAFESSGYNGNWDIYVCMSNRGSRSFNEYSYIWINPAEQRLINEALWSKIKWLSNKERDEAEKKLRDVADRGKRSLDILCQNKH